MKDADPMKCECIRWCREWKPGDMSEDGSGVVTHHPRCTGAQASASEPWHFCQDCGEESGATKERDDLREQVARLEAHRDGAMAECRRLQVIDAELARDRDRLRAALETYSIHREGCYWSSSLHCTCGLTEAPESKP